MEDAFVFKVLAEKAITSQGYELQVLLDMSKAFDTVSRADLINDLSEVLDEDELHLIYILLNDVKYTVRCGKTFGENICTNIGTPQGDSLSAILFTFYLAKSLTEHKEKTQLEHNCCTSSDTPSEDLLPEHLKDHMYGRPSNTKIDKKGTWIKNDLSIDQQYADDISFISTNRGKIDTIKSKIPKKLKERNLNVNESKTEDYTIKKNGDTSWKSCKYLGSLPDTTSDVTRRKQLAFDAFNSMKKFYHSKKVSIAVKTCLLDAFVKSVSCHLGKSQISFVISLMRDCRKQLLFSVKICKGRCY